jgi:tripartite-type tricarboxylate transporter receptor subunit TctC
MLTRIVIAALALIGLAGAGASADPVADFYRGKQVQLIVGYGTGGGYDVYARALARHIGRHIPGNPSVVVQNMPGAGSLRAANFLYNAAPKDGTAFGLFARNMPLLAIIGGNPNVQFDPRKFTWLGSSSSFADDAYLLFVRKDAPVKSVDDARKPGGPPLILAGTAEGATGNDVPVLLRDALGLNIKLISGYPDSGAIFLAVDRKEAEGRTVDYSSVKTSKPDWLKPDGNMHALVQFGRTARHPDFPDVPTARELARDERSRALIEVAELPLNLARPYVAPPGVPSDRAKALQHAFIATHRDPQFLDEAARLKMDVSVVTSDEALRLIDKIGGAPPDILKTIEKLLADNKGG